MPTIRATCASCGDIDLGVLDVRARLCAENDHAEYRFVCTVCSMVSVKQLQLPTLQLLVEAGVHVDTWHLPAEIAESREVDGSTIDHNDVLDFHNLLADEADFAAAISQLHIDDAAADSAHDGTNNEDGNDHNSDN